MSMFGMRSFEFPMIRLFAILALFAALWAPAYAASSNAPGFNKGVVAKACASLICLAQVPSSHAGLGTPAVAGGSYTGPGDIFTFNAWWATHNCYNTAYSGNVSSIWDSATGTTTHTLVTCSNGGTVNETINALSTTCAVACEVEELYDQSGALACAGSTACHLGPNNHVTGRPPVVTSALNSTICMQIGSTGKLATAANYTQAQPFSASVLAERTAFGTTLIAVISNAINNTIRVGFSNTANNAGLYTGNAVLSAASATDNAYHAMAYMANNTSSVIRVDSNSNVTGSIGSTTGFSAETIGVPNTSSQFGVFCEGGLANGDQSANFSTLNSNIHTRWNF